MKVWCVYSISEDDEGVWDYFPYGVFASFEAAERYVLQQTDEYREPIEGTEEVVPTYPGSGIYWRKRQYASVFRHPVRHGELYFWPKGDRVGKSWRGWGFTIEEEVRE